MSLFNTGVRPAIDEYLAKKTAEVRDYGDYWSASSAGYCKRLQVLRRLKVPPVPEMREKAAIQTRVFESGHIFHEWIQRITKEAGLSIAQELELQDEELMIRGHIDDLVLIGGKDEHTTGNDRDILDTTDSGGSSDTDNSTHLILYDYKTAHSASFNYKKNQPTGYYHTMQLGTYAYMIRKLAKKIAKQIGRPDLEDMLANLIESRIMSISKDDLRLHETDTLYTSELEKQVRDYWTSLNAAWKARKMPPCTCLDHDGGFLGRRSKKGKIYNDYFYNDEPCSLVWYQECKGKGLIP